MDRTTDQGRVSAQELRTARAVLDGRPVVGPLSGPVGAGRATAHDVVDVLEDALARLQSSLHALAHSD